MKLLLIKIGKVSSTLKREGFWSGGRVVFNYLRIFIKNSLVLGKGDILIIGGGVGDVAHYRMMNHAEELRFHGFRVTTTMTDNPFLPKLVSRYKIFIFQRVLFSGKVAKMVDNIKSQNKEIIFETDDLVFDKKFIQETDYYKNKMSFLEKMQYKEGVGQEIIVDPYVKVCTTTTTYLGKILEEYGKKVFIVKNKLSEQEVEICEGILKNIPRIKDGYVRLGYFSGTASHNLDFAVITEAIFEIMKKYEKVKLLLAGPLDTENKLNEFGSRVERLPLVPRGRHYENIFKANINLAPLVLGDPYCEAKSELKFFEAGILEVPTVAIRNQTYIETISDGEDGFLAKNKSEWVEKISRLIEDENLRRVMGKKAREKVLWEYTTKNSHEEQYYNYLRKKL
jgi:O-antigen biosynthesis protein